MVKTSEVLNDKVAIGDVVKAVYQKLRTRGEVVPGQFSYAYHFWQDYCDQRIYALEAHYNEYLIIGECVIVCSEGYSRKRISAPRTMEMCLVDRCVLHKGKNLSPEQKIERFCKLITGYRAFCKDVILGLDPAISSEEFVRYGGNRSVCLQSDLAAFLDTEVGDLLKSINEKKEADPEAIDKIAEGIYKLFEKK